MMYWPLSVIASSPLLHPTHAQELRQFDRGAPSHGALVACFDVVRSTPGVEVPRLIVVDTIGAPPRQTYVRCPEAEEWAILERAGFMLHHDKLVLFVDALH